MYPNRDAARIKDPVLRASIYLARNLPKDKRRYWWEQHCREYYSADPNELCVPVSMLRALSGQESAQLARTRGTVELIRQAEISRVVSWVESGLFETNEGDLGIEDMRTWTHEPGDHVPAEVWRKLLNRRLEGGMSLKFRKEPYVVIELFLGASSPLPGKLIRILPSHYEITIIHQRHIDFGA